MSVFSDVRDDLAGKLTAAGVANVTTDPAANVPYVLVDVMTVTGSAGYGGWTGTCPIRIAVPPPGDATAAAALEDQLELVLRTLGGVPADPGVLGESNVPVYTVTVPVDIPNPDC